MRVRPLFAWYDFWIGAFWDRQRAAALPVTLAVCGHRDRLRGAHPMTTRPAEGAMQEVVARAMFDRMGYADKFPASGFLHDSYMESARRKIANDPLLKVLVARIEAVERERDEARNERDAAELTVGDVVLQMQDLAAALRETEALLLAHHAEGEPVGTGCPVCAQQSGIFQRNARLVHSVAPTGGEG